MKKTRTPLIPGVSRRDIAGKLGLSPRTVEGFEQGRKPIPLWIRKAVEVIWGIDLAAGYQPGSDADPRD